MNICAVNFSYAENSMGLKGLQLFNDIQPFAKLINVTDYNIPVCNSNRADGEVPECVHNMFNDMNGYDAYVFSVAEYSGAYCVGFKNIMDWFVVKTFYNSTLGEGYPFTNKPIVVLTFTPTINNGDRHFEMTSKLLSKLGATVADSIVMQDGWNTVLPDNSDAFIVHHQQMINSLNTCVVNTVDVHPKAQRDAQRWVTKYEDWDNAWKRS